MKSSLVPWLIGVAAVFIVLAVYELYEYGEISRAPSKPTMFVKSCESIQLAYLFDNGERAGTTVRCIGGNVKALPDGMQDGRPPSVKPWE